MRRITAAVPLALAALVVLATSACTKPPRHAKVTPSLNLLDGQEVAIDITGYPAATKYIIWQCEVGRELTEGCTTEPLATVATDAAGAVSITAFVESTFTDQEGGLVDCTQPVACDITIHDPATNSNLAWLHTEFAGHDGLTVTPDRDLTDGQVIRVQGSQVGGGNKVMQCPTGVGDYTVCDMRTLQYTDGSSQDFDIQMTIYATIEDSSGNTTDCTVPGACMIVSDLSHGWSLAFPSWHPLEFD